MEEKIFRWDERHPIQVPINTGVYPLIPVSKNNNKKVVYIIRII